MARRTISDEETAKAAALHRAGHSFKSISETLKVHPRTAKALVARAAASGEAQHWQEVASRVDARFLADHFALLLYASSGVSWAVGKTPLMSRLTPRCGLPTKWERPSVQQKTCWMVGVSG